MQHATLIYPVFLTESAIETSHGTSDADVNMALYYTYVDLLDSTVSFIQSGPYCLILGHR